MTGINRNRAPCATKPGVETTLPSPSYNTILFSFSFQHAINSFHLSFMAINIHSIPLPSVSPTWRQASLDVSKSHMVYLMLEIYAPGSIDFPAWGKLPLHRYGHFQSCILKIFNSISLKSPKVAIFEPRMLLIIGIQVQVESTSHRSYLCTKEDIKFRILCFHLEFCTSSTELREIFDTELIQC